MHSFNQFVKENLTEKTLYIARGIPSSGKSTIMRQKLPEKYIFSADKFFEKDGRYNFNPNLLGVAHRICFTGVEDSMKSGVPEIGVDNTNTTPKEIRPYVDLAKNYGYKVEIVESKRPEWLKLSNLLNRGIKSGPEISSLLDFFYEDNKKTHNVPRGTYDKMIERWVPTPNLNF